MARFIRPQIRARQRRLRPKIEALEDRLVLSPDVTGLEILSTTTGVAVPTLLRLELVTNNTNNGSTVGEVAANTWGTHKLRTITTSNGDVYTTVTTDGSDGTGDHSPYSLWKRNHISGTWSVVLTGVAGREPPNLLRGPQDQIYIVTWDKGWPSLTTSTDGINFSGPTLIPGNWYGPTNYPYSGAAISSAGDLYVIQTNCDAMVPGETRIGYRMASDGVWHMAIMPTDYRYSYYFTFASLNGKIKMEGLRNPTWASVPGYSQPNSTTFQYMFDGLRQYRSTDIRTGVSANTYVITEEPQTAAYDAPSCFAHDVYVDTSGNMHIYYLRNGASNLGVHTAWQAILDSSGNLFYNAVQTGMSSERSNRLLQSPTDGQIYMLDSTGKVYPAGLDGKTWGAPTQLDFSRYPIDAGDYSIFLAAPRGGTPLSTLVDGVYASGRNWVYFRIQLP